MAAKTDTTINILGTSLKELRVRGAIDLLPNDLRGTAIEDQIARHGATLASKSSNSAQVSSAVERATKITADTKIMLTRIRYSLLGAYPSTKDPRLADFGPLGPSKRKKDNYERLKAQRSVIEEKLSTGELVLVEDLRPAAIDVQLALQLGISQEKTDEKAEDQTATTELEKIRKDSREMVQRIKAFVRSFYGPEAFPAFGFALPKPPVKRAKKKLPVEETKPTPEETKPTE